MGLDVILTTESRSILQEYDTSKSSFGDLTFIRNLGDVAQDTGFLQERDLQLNITADEAMLSAMSSLRMQLNSRVALGNCCSNFHLLLSDLVAAGCTEDASFGQLATFHCLQDHPNPNYHLCCSWDKSSPHCLQRDKKR